MRAKHNKKNSKNKEIENNTTTQYEEKYNDVILNDLVPEDRKEEFNIQDGEHQPRKRVRKNGFKFNVGFISGLKDSSLEIIEIIEK